MTIIWKLKCLLSRLNFINKVTVVKFPYVCLYGKNKNNLLFTVHYFEGFDPLSCYLDIEISQQGSTNTYNIYAGGIEGDEDYYKKVMDNNTYSSVLNALMKQFNLNLIKFDKTNYKETVVKSWRTTWESKYKIGTIDKVEVQKLITRLKNKEFPCLIN